MQQVVKGKARKGKFVRAEALGIEQHKVVHLPVSALNPAPYNPRKISPSMFEALKANIVKHGFLQPVVVQRQGNVIIAGHQRVKALKEVCVEQEIPVPKVPCVVIDVTDIEAKKLNLALNRVGGEFDARLLGEMFVDLRDAEVSMEDFGSLGFEVDEVSKYLRLVQPPEAPVPPADELGTFAQSATLALEFSDIRQRDAVKKLLKERSDLAKKTSGELVADALGVRMGS